MAAVTRSKNRNAPSARGGLKKIMSAPLTLVNNNFKIMTWIVLAITIALTIIFVVMQEKQEDNQYTAGSYILIAIIYFVALEFLALYVIEPIFVKNFNKL